MYNDRYTSPLKDKVFDALGKVGTAIAIVNGVRAFFAPDPIAEAAKRFDYVDQKLEELSQDIAAVADLVTQYGEAILAAITKLEALELADAINDMDSVEVQLSNFRSKANPTDREAEDLAVAADSALGRILTHFDLRYIESTLPAEQAADMLQVLTFAVGVRMQVALAAEDGAFGNASLSADMTRAADAIDAIHKGLRAGLKDYGQVIVWEPLTTGIFSQATFAHDDVRAALKKAYAGDLSIFGTFGWFTDGAKMDKYISDRKVGGVTASEILDAALHVHGKATYQTMYKIVLGKMDVDWRLARYDYYKLDVVGESQITGETVIKEDVIYRHPNLGYGENLRDTAFWQAEARSMRDEVAKVDAKELDVSSLLDAAQAYRDLADGQMEIGASGPDKIDGSAGNDLLVGVAGNDTLDGFADHDVIRAGPGNDKANGGAGADYIEGGAGKDLLHGNGGADRLVGDAGADKLLGGWGRDQISGGLGNDQLLGQQGPDVLSGDKGDDTLKGGDGDDNLYGRSGDDSLLGGAGNDTMAGGEGRDRLLAGEGDDQLFGGSGADTLDGAAGDDALFGGPGNDKISGSPGADTLIGGRGQDTLTGGPAPDVFVFGPTAGKDRITEFDPGLDQIQLNGFDLGDVSVMRTDTDTILTFGNVEVVLEDVRVGLTTIEWIYE